MPDDSSAVDGGKKESTRQKIFEVSLRLFVQKGYGSTTIRDIAGAANISTGLLFHYYPNKQAVLAAHLELAAEGMSATLALLGSKQTPLDIFSSIAELTLGSLRQPVPRQLYLLMNQPLPADAISDTQRQKINKDAIIAASLPLIKQGQQLGKIKHGDPHALAVAFWGAIQGIPEILANRPDMPVPKPDWVIDILMPSAAQ